MIARKRFGKMPAIKVKALMGSIFTIIIMLVFYYTDDEINLTFDTKAKLVFLFAVCIYSFILITMYKTVKRVDLFFIFICLSIPFLFGRYILYILNMVPVGREIFDSKLEDRTYIKTGLFALACLCALYVGYLLVHRKSEELSKFKNRIKPSDEQTRYSLNLICKIIAIISIVPFIIKSSDDIRLSFMKGYGYRIVEGSSRDTSLIVIMAEAFLPAVIGMHISRKKHDKLVYIFIVLYLVLYSLTGSRINTFCYITLLLFLYLYTAKMVKKIPWVKIAIISIIVAFAFSIMSSARSLVSQTSLSVALSEALKNIWQNNPLSAILVVAGNTFIATSAALQYCPSPVPHLMGMSYLCTFIYVIPNALTGDITSRFLFTDDAFAKYVVSYGGVGSSFVAESYYNFGPIIGLIALVLIGYLWGVLCKKIEDALIQGDIIKLYIYAQLYVVIVFMIRSDLVYRLRPFVWYTLPIVGLAILVKKHLQRRNRWETQKWLQ